MLETIEPKETPRNKLEGMYTRVSNLNAMYFEPIVSEKINHSLNKYTKEKMFR